MTEEIKPTENNKVETKSTDPTKTFLIALGLLIIVLVGVFLIPRLFPDEGVKTLTEIHKENINDGKDTDTAYVYNGYSFVYYDGLWYTQVLNAINGNLYDVPLHYGPKDLTDVIVYGDFNTFFEGIINGNIFNYSKRYYLTFNPDDENMGYVALATGELTQNLVTTFDIAPVSACIEEGVGCEDVPIVTCENTDDPVLYLTSGEPTAVYAEGNCITVQGNKEELVRAVDRFVLKMYNVMI